MVTPPIFCAGYRANRSATASAHLPPKYPSCRGVTQDFAKSFRGQHGQPKYLSRRAVKIGKPTKELNGMSPTKLGMRHSSCRRPKRSANGPKAHQCPLFKHDYMVCQWLRFWGKADMPFCNCICPAFGTLSGHRTGAHLPDVFFRARDDAPSLASCDTIHGGGSS